MRGIGDECLALICRLQRVDHVQQLVLVGDNLGLVKEIKQLARQGIHTCDAVHLGMCKSI